MEYADSVAQVRNGRFSATILVWPAAGRQAPDTPPKSGHSLKGKLKTEILDATELALSLLRSISFRERACAPDQEIVRTDHPATRFERSANPGMVMNNLVGKNQNLDPH
jgi:hypothetical protein